MTDAADRHGGSQPEMTDARGGDARSAGARALAEIGAALEVADPEAMHAFGVRIAGLLRAGDVVLLTGDLGAGKTTFTRGLGEGLGVRGPVTSPTFVLARTHPSLVGGPALVHVDAYRLGSALELDDLDIDFERSIVVVEWAAGMLDGITDTWLELQIERPVGGTATDDGIEPRIVRITGSGARWSDLGWLRASRD